MSNRKKNVNCMKKILMNSQRLLINIFLTHK